MLSQGPITARLIESGHDDLGRWVYHTFSGRDNKPVTVMALYQVCRPGSRRKGSSTASAQQECMLRIRGQVDLDARRAFRRDLKAFLTPKIKSKHEVILAGDFNEVLGSESSGMSSICSEFHLLDVFQYKHKTDQVPTYSRGPNRLDYCLATPRAAEAVKSCGYDPFGHRMFSDHRAFFVDLDNHILFGTHLPSLPPFESRDIKSNNPKQVTIYVRELHRMLTSRNVFSRAKDLIDSDERNDGLAEVISRDVDQFRRAAVKSCSRQYKTEWSVSLASARNKVSILKRALFTCRTTYDMHTQIESLRMETGANFLIPTTEAECDIELRKAQKEVRTLSKECKEKRKSEQLERRLKYEQSSDPDSKKQAAIQRKLEKAEEISSMFSKIGWLRKSGQSNGLSHVEVPTDPTSDPKTCTDWRTIDVPTEIEQALLERNQKHFGQAKGTPFTVPPLSEHIDFSASTHTAELILEGVYDTSALDEVTQLFISHLQQHVFDDQPQMTAAITESDFIGKLKNWKESTSTSPSGFHLGHWKALIARHEHHGKDDEKCIELDQIQSDLRQVVLHLTNYALKWGYSYERWKTVVNVMIFKDPGCYKIHRLRVIHLYEADYNLILATKWRQLIHRAKDSNLIHPGQNGGVPQKNALDPVFVEEMQNEISRSSRKPLIKFDNDATSCYDRILVSLACLISRKFGMPKSVTLVMANTLEECKYKLKTMLGVSEASYSHCEFHPIYGTGQGSGNSPTIWCIISTVLFECHESQAHGAIYETPDSRHRIHFSMVGFVDDSTGQVNAFLDDHPPTADRLIEMMRVDAQLWNDLLWNSGGDLELPKCSYHMLLWKFASNGSPTLSPGKVGPDLVVLSGNKTKQQVIKHKSAYSAHKTLGHYKEPSGNQRKQFSVLQQKSNEEAKFVACSPLTNREAWTYYYAVYLPRISYPLANSFFSWQELDRIQKKAIREIFAKCGFNRNTRRSILYGPHYFGGANFRHLYIEQSIGQIQMFLRHWRTDDDPGRLLRIAVAWTQLSVGTSVSFLTDTSTPLPHCESKWLLSLRTFLHTINGSLELDDGYVPPIQREHDFHIMDQVLASQQFQPKQILLINYCRLYLQAVTVSDITDPDGLYLDLAKLKGESGPPSSTTRLHKIYQEKPPLKAWQAWRKACKLWTGKKSKLLRPLGKWLVTPQQSRHQWKHYHTPDNQFYTAHDGIVLRLPIIRRIVQEGNDVEVPALPPTASPASISQLRNMTWQLDQPLYFITRPPPSRIPSTFLTTLQSLDPWEKALFDNIKLTIPPFQLARQLSNTEFNSASDGSVLKTTSASFAWVLCLGTDRVASCSGPVFGYNPTSYRAEAYGMLSFCRFLYQLREYTGTSSFFGGTLGCDNISLVNNVTATTQKPQAGEIPELFVDDDVNPDTVFSIASFSSRTMVSDWDALSEITAALETINYPLRITHVKGHQDRKRPYSALPLLAQLNVDADKLAGQYQDKFGQPRPTVLRFPTNPVQLHLQSINTITYKFKSSLRYASTAPELKEHIQATNNWDEPTMQSIDWDAHSSSISRGSIPRNHSIKLVHDILPTNALVSKYDELRSAKCPCCQHPIEDRDHILLCEHPTRIQGRIDILRHLRSTLTRLKTDPELITIMIDGIDAWFHSTPIEPESYPTAYQLLITQQNYIGWRQLFNGRLTTEWAQLQQNYLVLTSQLAKKRTGHLWAVSVISKIWTEWYVIWEHRNQRVHGHDWSTKQQIKRARVLKELKLLYSRKQNMKPTDRNLLMDSVHEHSQEPIWRISNWLNTYRTLFQQSIRNAKKTAIQHTKSIRHYFRRSADPHE